MLNPKTNLRELAYVVKIDNVFDMEGVNNQIAVVNGWTIFVKRDQFHTGDLAIYFEIDSKVPATEQFAFLEKYKYAVKTQKYVKGRVISQGLLMHPSDFGWVDMLDDNDNQYIVNIKDNETYELGTFLTEKLGVTYYEPEDNSRKADMKEVLQKKLDSSIAKWVKKHPVLAKLPFIKRIKYVILRKKIFTKKAKKKANWPSWVVKTDEERCQNMPQLFASDTYLHTRCYVATEKIDGTSTTFTMRRDGSKKDRREFYVCSRNVVFDKPDKKSFYDDTDGNIYLEMAKKYDMEAVCNKVLDQLKSAMFITFQGESYGGTIQKRKYCNEHRCAIFNIIIGWKDGEVERLNPIAMRIWLKNLDINNLELVPIFDENFYLPNTCEELLQIATGSSSIDGGMREGLVFRSLDGKVSFKAVSNEFLLKFHS